VEGLEDGLILVFRTFQAPVEMIKMSQNLLESLLVLCELCLDGVERLIHRLETPIEHFETPLDRLETKGDLFELPAPGIL